MQKKVISFLFCVLLGIVATQASTIRSFVMKENFTDWQTRHSSRTITVITGKEKDIGLWVLIGNTQNGEKVQIIITKNGAQVFEKTFLAGGYANDVIFFNDPFTSWENATYVINVVTPYEAKSFPIPVKIASAIVQPDVTAEVIDTQEEIPLKSIADTIKLGKLDDAAGMLEKLPAGDGADTLAAALLDAYLENYDFEGAIKACELLRRTNDGIRRTDDMYSQLRNRETLKEKTTIPALERFYRMRRLLDEKDTDGVTALLAEHPSLEKVYARDIVQLSKQRKTPFARSIITAVLSFVLSIIVIAVVRKLRPDHLKRGLAAYQEGRFDEAAVSLEKYIKQTQSVDVSIYRRLAEVYVKLDDFEKAIDVYKQCDALLHTHIKEA